MWTFQNKLRTSNLQTYSNGPMAFYKDFDKDNKIFYLFILCALNHGASITVKTTFLWALKQNNVISS